VALEFSRNLTGANCQVGSQTIISLSATEAMPADYATASAVCLAPVGAHAKGAAVESIEGGVSTGWWEVDDPVTMRSGERTWRRKVGDFGYAHIPFVSYRLRRKGYMAARSTLSRANIGADNYPAKFMSVERWLSRQSEFMLKGARHELPWAEVWRELDVSTWHVVPGAAYIVQQIADWVGLPVNFRTQLTTLPDEYIAANKSVIAAISEVAGWSGAEVYLDRSGTLQIYDWGAEYNSGTIPHPAVELEREEHDSLYPVTHVTVVGSGFSGYDVAAGGGFATRHAVAVEQTESLETAAGERPVEERIEIREYPITPTLAAKIARSRLSRVALEAGLNRYRGPAEGSQAIAPLTHRVLSVSRTLQWDGSKYRYEIDYTAPRAAMVWPSLPSDDGWFTGWGV